MSLWNRNVSPVRHLGAALCCIAAYVLAYQFSGVFEFWPDTASLFFPAGIAVALLVGLGPGHAITVLVATLLAVHWPPASPLGTGAKVAWAFLVTGGYTFMAWSLRSRVRIDPRIRRFRDAAWLVAQTVVVSFGVALAVTLMRGLVTGAPLAAGVVAPRVIGFWIGDAAGILSLAPFLLIDVIPRLEGRQPQRMKRQAGFYELVVLLMTTAAAIGLIFWSVNVGSTPPLYILFLPPAWLAIRTGLPATAAVNIVLTTAAAAALAWSGAEKEPTVVMASALIAIAAGGLLLGALVEERMAARSQLELRNRYLERAEQVANFGSWTWDLQSNAFGWSDQLYRLHGLEPGQPVTVERMLNRVEPSDRDRLKAAIDAAIQDGSGFELLYRIRADEGRERILQSWGEVERNPDGVPVRVIGTCRDVTDERLREEQAFRSRRLEAMGGMLAAVAHDFNNYLTVVGGRAALIEQGDPGSDAARDAAEIREAVHRAQHLTQQLVGFARGEAFEPEVVDLSAELKAQEWVLQRLAGPGVTLTLTLAPDLPPVEVERGRLERVITNLVTNARSADAHLIRVETAPVAPPAGTDASVPWMRLTVADDGVGMPPDVLERIFDPYFTTRRGQGGTGLGLATVYRIVEQFGGVIHVDSRPGRGTAFHIDLPGASARAEGARERTDSLPRLAAGGR